MVRGYCCYYYYYYYYYYHYQCTSPNSKTNSRTKRNSIIAHFQKFQLCDKQSKCKHVSDAETFEPSENQRIPNVADYCRISSSFKRSEQFLVSTRFQTFPIFRTYDWGFFEFEDGFRNEVVRRWLQQSSPSMLHPFVM